MTGPKQHHIPKFFQRGFGIRRSGRPKEIWVFEKDKAPETELISRTARDEYFYSTPSTDGSLDLDDEITKLETPLALVVAGVRALPVGSAVVSEQAASIIAHLAPRTAHLRGFVGHGMGGLFEGSRGIFSDQATVERLLGFRDGAPSDSFRESLADLRKNPQIQQVLQLLRLPDPVVEKVAFTLVKENFESPRLSRRLHYLRGWSHGKTEQVFT